MNFQLVVLHLKEPLLFRYGVYDLLLDVALEPVDVRLLWRVRWLFAIDVLDDGIWFGLIDLLALDLHVHVV